MAEIKFYQDAEKTVQIYPEIDPDGNFPGVTVGLANNLVSPDGSDTNENFLFRSTGGTTINPSEGYAKIKKILGNASSTTIRENLVTNVIASGVTAATTTTSTFRTAVSSTSGTYNFIYTPTITYTSNLVYSFDKNAFANTVSQTPGTYTFNYVAKVEKEDASKIISAFNKTTFINKVSQTPGTYTFEYDGSNWSLNESNVTISQYGITTTGSEVNGDSIVINYSDNHWAISGATISMSNYGITTTGTESVGDSIVMTYSSNDWQLNNEIVSLANYGITINSGSPVIADNIQVVYIAEQIGVIVVAHPSALKAVGLNAFNYENNVFNNFTLDSNGAIIASSGQSVGFFKCLGNYTYTIFDSSSAAGITRVGYLADKPTTSSTNATILSQVTNVVINGEAYGTATNTTYKQHYTAANEGWMIVTGPSALMEDLCCHLTWDQTYDESYETYWEYDFTINYTDKNGAVALPYGLVKVDSSYQDIIDYEAGKIYRNVERIAYSAANLETIQAQTTHYIYDSNYIYYGIDTITSNMGAISNAYPVSDFGTEEFLDTNISVQAAIFYQINLRDKLRNDVEILNNKTQEITASSTKDQYPSAKADFVAQTVIRQMLGLDIDTFSTTKTYAVGDYVVYNGKLWKCTTAVSSAGAWTGTSTAIMADDNNVIAEFKSSQFNKLYSSKWSGTTYAIFTAECDENSCYLYPNADYTKGILFTDLKDLYQRAGIVITGKEGRASISRTAGGNWEESYLFTTD